MTRKTITTTRTNMCQTLRISSPTCPRETTGYEPFNRLRGRQQVTSSSRSHDPCTATKREHLQSFEALSPESEGRNLALTVLRVPYSLDSGLSLSCYLTAGSKGVCSTTRKTIRHRPYRGTSRIRKRTPLGTYRRPMPKVLCGSAGATSTSLPSHVEVTWAPRSLETLHF